MLARHTTSRSPGQTEASQILKGHLANEFSEPLLLGGQAPMADMEIESDESYGRTLAVNDVSFQGRFRGPSFQSSAHLVNAESGKRRRLPQVARCMGRTPCSQGRHSRSGKRRKIRWGRKRRSRTRPGTTCIVRNSYSRGRNTPLRSGNAVRSHTRPGCNPNRQPKFPAADRQNPASR
jgi:hypothetical protein